MACDHNCSSCQANCDKNKSMLITTNENNHIKNIIAVMSGKGGVGKSMVTTTLAVSLAKQGFKVGVLDSDITGPSIPKAFGLKPGVTGNSDNLMFPPETEKYGIKVMSINVLLDDKFVFKDKDGSISSQEMSYSEASSDFVDSTGETINGLTTGESGFMGKTLFPGNQAGQNSPDSNIYLIINKRLSERGRAEVYSHEGNGHALLYVRTKGDYEKSTHHVGAGWVEQNLTLKELIIKSKQETILNMK